jgi:hypothetical protein
MKIAWKNHSVALLVIALAGTLTACQGGEQKATRQASTAAPPSTSAPAPASTAGDKVMARKLILTKADLPAGWKPAKDVVAPISLGEISGPAHARTATAAGKGFEKGTQAVASGAEIVRPGEDLAEDAALLRSPEFRRTLKTEFGKAMAEGNPVGSRGPVTVKPLQIAKYGQYSIGYRVTTKITMQGFGVEVYMDLVWLAGGRSEVTATFAGADGPFDPALQKQLIAKLGTRLAAAG